MGRHATRVRNIPYRNGRTGRSQDKRCKRRGRCKSKERCPHKLPTRHGRHEATSHSNTWKPIKRGIARHIGENPEKPPGVPSR